MKKRPEEPQNINDNAPVERKLEIVLKWAKKMHYTVVAETHRTRASRIGGAAQVKYGYARVSTDDQNADMQRSALTKNGCKKVFTDNGISGATAERPALRRLLKVLKAGDSVTVWKLDRLGRSTRNLIILLDDLKPAGREVQIHYRSDQHRDARRPRHVADDCRHGGDGAQPH